MSATCSEDKKSYEIMDELADKVPRFSTYDKEFWQTMSANRKRHIPFSAKQRLHLADMAQRYDGEA